MLPPARRPLCVLTAVALLGLAGCGEDEPGPAADPAPARSGLPQDEGGPLTGLPACDPPPAERVDDSDVEGLLLPRQAVVTEVQTDDRLVTVQAYVAQTPIEVRRYFEQAPGLELFEVEDEVFEAEVLYRQGMHQVYVKASAPCETGSDLLVVIGPAGTDDDLPTPGDG